MGARSLDRGPDHASSQQRFMKLAISLEQEESSVSEAKRRQVLEEWNATDADFPRDKCVHQLFEEQARKTPQEIALVYRDQQLTFEEVNRRAAQLAQELR